MRGTRATSGLLAARLLAQACRRLCRSGRCRCDSHALCSPLTEDSPMRERLSAARTLPEDAGQATLVGRVHVPAVDGPALVAIVDHDVVDITHIAPTCSALLELDDPVAAVRSLDRSHRIAPLAEILANTP